MVVKAVSVWTWTEAEEAQLSFYEIAIKYSPWFKKVAVVATIKRACERFKASSPSFKKKLNHIIWLSYSTVLYNYN